MTQSTFVRIVSKMFTDLGVSIKSSQMSALNALGRSIDGKEIDGAAVLRELQSIFGVNYEITGSGWKSIEKQVKRLR